MFVRFIQRKVLIWCGKKKTYGMVVRGGTLKVRVYWGSIFTY